MTLKELLKKNDMTGARLARILGVNRATVSCWAVGKCNPPLAKVPILAEVLGVSQEDIIACFGSGRNGGQRDGHKQVGTGGRTYGI